MLKDEGTACTNAVFASSRSLVAFDWTAPPNVAQTQRIRKEYGYSARVRSFERNYFSIVILRTRAHKMPRISETEQAIDVKLGATLGQAKLIISFSSYVQEFPQAGGWLLILFFVMNIIKVVH